MLQWMLAGAPLDVIRFTVTPVASKTVTLQDFSAPFAATVDWGDGATDRITADTPVSHVYADATPRQIIIRGGLGGFWHGSSPAPGAALVTSLDEIASESLTSLADTFRQCVGLVALPQVIAAPHVSSFVRTFCDCKSITSDLPALWLTHAAAQHQNCFTRCFLSLYGKHGTACPHRQYVPAVQQQTYFQKYGTSCPAATFVPAIPPTTYYQQYGNCGLGGCSYGNSFAKASLSQKCACGRNLVYEASYIQCTGNAGTVSQEPSTWRAGTIFDPQTRRNKCDNCGRFLNNPPYVNVADRASFSQCRKVYSSGNAAWYRCTQPDASGVGECQAACKRVYTSGQSAYYKCARSGATCASTNCPYAFANQASVTAAQAAGWA